MDLFFQKRGSEFNFLSSRFWFVTDKLSTGAKHSGEAIEQLSDFKFVQGTDMFPLRVREVVSASECVFEVALLVVRLFGQVLFGV